MPEQTRPTNGRAPTDPLTHQAESTRDDDESLQAWRNSQPDNVFVADHNFQRSLEFHWGLNAYRDHAPRLYEFGALAAREIDALARRDNEAGNLPRLKRFDALGRRQEKIEFHPSHHQAGQLIFGSGVMSVLGSPGNNMLSLALFYLSAQNGEAGHNCALACTAGAIKILQAKGTPELRQRFLPRLLDEDYDTLYQGAQFITEIQGGSDVGANRCRVTPWETPPVGTWSLFGEKWFCSNINADCFLVTARVPDQGQGSDGLGLFLVPRHLESGELNAFAIHRLKEKLGTRSLATAEVGFDGALAYEMGSTSDGLQNLMNYVINTSRVYNAVACAGNARRAFVIAWTYAQNRAAFGRPIIQFPLVRDSLAQMNNDQQAMLAGTWDVIGLLDARDKGEAGDDDLAFLRLAINLNKFRAADLAHQVIVRAIELLGGNGAIETFSVLPRLLRDNIVYENWEGSHNVLLAQAQRDFRRRQLHLPFLARIERMLTEVEPELSSEALALLNQIKEELDLVLAMDELTASLFFRPLMDRLVDVWYVACLVRQGRWEMLPRRKGVKIAARSRQKIRQANFYLQRRAAGCQASQIVGYADTIGYLSASL